MSKLNEALVMMAEQKETFEVNGKTFQIIEVKEAEQPKVRVTMADPNAKPVEVILEKIQPDYSHLVGKWVKCNDYFNAAFAKDKWYQVIEIDGDDGLPIFNDNFDTPSGFNLVNTKAFFDINNPQNENPDEVKKILVPKEIKISIDRQGMNLHFGNNQMLCVVPYCDSYSVCPSDRVPIQCELIKCERAELVKGDLVFRTEEDEGFDLLSHHYYSVIINDSKHCYVADNKNICVSEVNWKHWYKLQPIEQ